MEQKIKLRKDNVDDWSNNKPNLYESLTCHATGGPNSYEKTLVVNYALPKTKSHLKIGNMVIYNTYHFNWFQRKMWKLFFGFEIENVKENNNESSL